MIDEPQDEVEAPVEVLEEEAEVEVDLEADAPEDVWSWAEAAAGSWNLEELLDLKRAVLSYRKTRRALDRKIDEFDLEAIKGDEALIAGVACWLRADFQRASGLLEGQEGNPVAAYARAESLLYGGALAFDGGSADPSGAAAILAKVKKGSRDHSRLHVEALIRGLELTDARKVLGGCDAEFQESADGQFLLGWIAECDAEYDESKAAFDASLEKDPEHPGTLFRRAYHHDLSAEDEEAMAMYEALAERKPPSINVLMNLGLLYEDAPSATPTPHTATAASSPPTPCILEPRSS